MSKAESIEAKIKRIEGEIKTLEKTEFSIGLEKKRKQLEFRIKHPQRAKFRTFLRGEQKKLEVKAWQKIKKFRKRKKRKLF